MQEELRRMVAKQLACLAIYCSTCTDASMSDGEINPFSVTMEQIKSNKQQCFGHQQTPANGYKTINQGVQKSLKSLVLQVVCLWSVRTWCLKTPATLLCEYKGNKHTKAFIRGNAHIDRNRVALLA